jgi:hypothetical protein
MAHGGSRMHRSIFLVCVTALVVSAATATAASLITGKNVKNGSLTGADIKSKSVPLGDLSKGTQSLIKKGSTTLPGGVTPGNQGENGAQGQQGPPGANGTNGSNGSNGANGAASVGPHWGPIDRNTIGSPVEELRNGPFVALPAGGVTQPPFGDGSLGLEVSVPGDATTREKASFGNEVDFAGDEVGDLSQVGFRYITTQENADRQGDGRNLPGITFEIDPNMATTSSNFSSLVWQPGPAPFVNKWTDYQDATSSGDWVLSGGAGTQTGCVLATPCTFAQVKAALADGGDTAKILTAAVTKGRDNAWQGAVDGLRINNEVFDFEMFGVTTRTP